MSSIWLWKSISEITCTQAHFDNKFFQKTSNNTWKYATNIDSWLRLCRVGRCKKHLYTSYNQRKCKPSFEAVCNALCILCTTSTGYGYVVCQHNMFRMKTCHKYAEMKRNSENHVNSLNSITFRPNRKLLLENLIIEWRNPKIMDFYYAYMCEIWVNSQCNSTTSKIVFAIFRALHAASCATMWMHYGLI